jgi:hypothetical protein
MAARGEEAQAAVQYLIWALEEIDKIGNQKAAEHARIAMEELSAVSAPRHHATASTARRSAALSKR